MFVRPSHIVVQDDTSSVGDISPQSGPSPSKDKSPNQESKIGMLGQRKGGIPTPSAVPKSR